MTRGVNVNCHLEFYCPTDKNVLIVCVNLSQLNEIDENLPSTYLCDYRLRDQGTCVKLLQLNLFEIGATPIRHVYDS